MDLNKIVNFINQKFSDTLDFKSNYYNLLLLTKLLNKQFSNNSFTVDIATILINNSEKLEKSLKILVNSNYHNKDFLIKKYFDLNELAELINAYFNINNLDISSWLGISNRPKIINEDFNKLVIQAQSGDILARNKLIEDNIGLVKFIISKYESRLIISDFDDLLNEGVLALIKSIERFDVNKGTKFSTYAVIWLKQNIFRYIANMERTIRRPIKVETLIWQVQNAQNTLIADNKPYEANDIAEFLNIDIKAVKKALDLISKGTIYSLDKTFGEDEDNSFSSFVANDVDIENDIIDKIYKDNLFELIRNYLSDKEYEIICYRFGKYGRIYSLEELGLKYHLTRERIRQIEKKAISKLSSPYFKSLISINDKNYEKINLGNLQTPKPVTYHLNKSFYAYFPDYLKQEVDYAFKSLSIKHKNLVYQIYGQSLTEYHLVSNTKCIYFEKTIVNTLNKILFLNRINKINILEYFSNYSYDEITFAINVLISSYKTIVYRKYGQSLTANYDLDYKETNILFKKIFPLISKYLILIHKLNSNSLFEIFPNIHVDELKYFISQLSLEDQNLIFDTYGHNLNEKSNNAKNIILLKVISTLTDEIYSPIFCILRKNIYELLNTNSQSEIIEAINRLNETDQNLIYARYSFDITKDYQKYLEFINYYAKDDFNELIMFIILKLIKIIVKKDSGKSKKFYERFEGFTKEQVDTVFNTLTNEDKEAIYFRFGPNLDTIYDYTNPKIRNKVEAVIQNIRNTLLKYYSTDNDHNNIKSFYDILRISHENTKIIMQCLSDGEIEDLYAYFGYDLENPKLLPLNKDFKTYIERVFFLKLEN